MQIHFSGTLMEDTDLYRSFMSHLSQQFPKQRWSCFVRSQILSSPLHFGCDAINRFLGFVLKVLGVIEAQYLFATSFIFSELFRSSSGFWSEVSFIDDVCESTSFLCFNWGVCVFSLVSAVESFWKVANLNYPQISQRLLPDSTWDWWNILLLVSGLWVTVPEWKCGISS